MTSASTSPPALDCDRQTTSIQKTQQAARARTFFWRLGILGLVLTLEGLRSSVNIGPVRSAIAQWFVTFVSMFLILGYPSLSACIRSLAREIGLAPVSWRFVSLHVVALGAVAAASRGLVSHSATSLYFWPLVGIWFIAGLAAILAGAGAVFPFGVWWRLIGAARRIWPAALFVSGCIWYFARSAWDAWDQSSGTLAQDVTFRLVTLILRPFLSPIVQDAKTHLVGSDRFSVTINGACSGWEGLALAAVFTVAWLYISRRVYRFPHALMLIPGALTLIFLLNTVRIAALVLIGHFGAPVVAMTGFHSQAGWIAFNAVALGIAVISPRMSWLVRERASSLKQTTPNVAVPYLMPFAVILASGMISRAASAQFEWLYPLRFVAGAIVLYVYRARYREWIRRPGWEAWVCGAVVFLMWIGLNGDTQSGSAIGTGLASIPAAARGAWLLFRVLGAVVTVPVAEELAFRGFLLRRLVASDFESVDLKGFHIVAFVLSSLAFGLMHGDRWIAGSLAGGLYAFVAIRRGRLMEAIVAHATTNALLAIWVVTGNRWYLW